jgi:hypothetical protein
MPRNDIEFSNIHGNIINFQRFTIVNDTGNAKGDTSVSACIRLRGTITITHAGLSATIEKLTCLG